MMNIDKYKYKKDKYSSKHLDESVINFNIVKLLKQHSKELEALDEWILFADRKLIPQILNLVNITRKLYQFKKEISVYRGIRQNHNVSANLGIKDPKINNIYNYKSNDEAISFSTDIKIARAFGNIVVESKLNNNLKYLTITPELCYIIKERRNLKEIETQDEVILLPPFDIDFKILEIEKTNFLW